MKIVKKFVSKNSLTVYSSAIMHKGFFRYLVLRKVEKNGQILINIVTNNVNYVPVFLKQLVNELREFSNSIYWTVNGANSMQFYLIN